MDKSSTQHASPDEGLYARAEECRARGELDDAEFLYASAFEVAALRSADVMKARVLTGLARVCYSQGDLEAAAKCFQGATDTARVAGDAEFSLLSSARVGFVAYDVGDVSRAEALFSSILDPEQ